MFKRILIFCLVLGPLLSDVHAQTGEVRGFVYDKKTGEPVIFTNVILREIMMGKPTDINGFYSLTKVKPGEYTLFCWGVGYDTAKVKIEIRSGHITSQNLFLVQKSRDLREVEIKGERVKVKENVNISVNTVTQKELKRLPTFGGEPDLVQYLQVLPGVVFSGDQGGQLYMRGGPPVMNKVMIDGMIIYNPFHSIGLFSVFDADIIRNADVYAGGFNAQYGGRIGGVIDVSTREGNKKRFSGKIAVNPITSKILLEGPISEFSEGGASASYLISYKNSYLNQTQNNIYKYVETKNGLPYSFSDFYGKFSYIGSNGSRINLFGFDYTDTVSFPETQYGWKNLGFGGNFLIVPEGSNTLINGNFGYSQYNMSQSESDQYPRNSSINSMNIGVNFTNFMGKDDIKYGFEIVGFTTDFQYRNSFGRDLTIQDNTTEFGAFAKYKKVLGRFVFEPGMRVQFYASLAEKSLEPRLSMKYNLSSSIRLKMAGGLYSQNLLAAVSDQDIVNLFYGFLSSPDNVPNSRTQYRRQTAQHGAAGIEIDLGRHADLNIEGFYKNFSQIVNVNRDKKYDNTDDRQAILTALGYNQQEIDRMTADFIAETGNAYGLDARFKYEHKHQYIWLVYSLTYVNRNDGIRSYVPNFDRRHNFNAVYTYTWGEKSSWSLNARWNFGSGFPFTPTIGFYENVSYPNGIGSGYTNQNGSLAYKYTDINTARLPYYHRLDISLSKKFQISEYKVINVIAAATNVYDRANIFYFDRATHERVNQLPLMPTIGFNFSF